MVRLGSESVKVLHSFVDPHQPVELSHSMLAFLPKWLVKLAKAESPILAKTLEKVLRTAFCPERT